MHTNIAVFILCLNCGHYYRENVTIIRSENENFRILILQILEFVDKRHRKFQIWKSSKLNKLLYLGKYTEEIMVENILSVKC